MSHYLKEKGGPRLVIMGETKQLVTLLTQFQEAMRMVKDIVEKSRSSKTSKRLLRKTLKNMTPLLQEINQYNEHLDPPRSPEKKTPSITTCIFLPLMRRLRIMFLRLGFIMSGAMGSGFCPIEEC
uniref:Uncharacterized protein n=1 Tax=Glycine max TaxID=3847 RepID=C6T5M1_SOYBN|nr:unknown [Glycine max]